MPARPRTLAAISRRLSQAVDQLSFDGAAAYVYNPLDYARRPHELYLERYGSGPKEVLFLGMNPGPFGMAQTGVPFGDVVAVRDWMGISAPVDHPPHEHPKRPVAGFDCPRREVSGSRLWGWAEERFGAPENFFERFFVVNYCPLVFMEESARNLTPDKLARALRDPLFDVCDEALRDIVRLTGATTVIGVGAFARDRARAALGDDLRVDTILHPSPASPRANRGWAAEAEKQLRALGIL